MSKPIPGLFVTATDTGVGKTYIAAQIAAQLHTAGIKVGVYKPVASGCRRVGDTFVSDDAERLWEAVGRPGSLDRVCPQCFELPLAPHRAAREAGRRVDPDLLRTGLDYWRERSDFLIVEGAGGLMSPLSDEDYVADLAADFGFPLVVVSRNALGTINQTLQTLIAAAARDLSVAGVVLNDTTAAGDASSRTNAEDLASRCTAPLLACVSFGGGFDRPIDWLRLALSP